MIRKVYIGIGNPGDGRQRALKTWIISDEETLRDAQASVAEFIADDFYNKMDEAEITEEQGGI